MNADIKLETLICQNCMKTMKKAEYKDGYLICPHCGVPTRIIIISGGGTHT